MEIVPMHYNSQLGLYDDNSDEDDGNGRFADEFHEEDNECVRRCEEDCGEAAWRVALCSRPGRAAIAVFTIMIFYLISVALASTRQSLGAEISNDGQPRAGINITRAEEVLNALCSAHEAGVVSGDSCGRLCFNRKWTVTDYYEGNKVVIVLKDGGQTAVYKSSHPFIKDFSQLDTDLTNDRFTDRVLEVVNEELKLGWPRHYKRHLVETLWPTLLRTPGESLSTSDRTSLWSLLQQPEFILFRVLPLTRVTPKIIGTCGQFYETESLVAFRMKGYYMNLKGKILVHIMGTLKLLYEFLNEPLQWCDVKFDNLGLSADYPKRFVLMDGDQVYTQSRLTGLLKGRPCETDSDCEINDCKARCTADMTCSDRSNSNLEVFCEKLVKKLFGNVWSANNKYLVACQDKGVNITQRLNELRLTWSWNLSDV